MTRTNIAPGLTSFVGREQELETLQRLAAGSRLVTLIGAGGIGKTRLAIEFAREHESGHRDGAWLVELASLADPDLVPEVALKALGLGVRTARNATASIVAAFAERDALIIIDNCEHLAEACAHLVEALLKGCPRLHILATSREVLGVAGETTWPVPSMAVPDRSRALVFEELRDCDALRLFSQRAAAARPGFRLTDDNAICVARLCERLDGIPLAIELAAARVRSLSVDVIEERLSDRFRFLRGEGRTTVARHKTLEAMLSWSHQLLSDAERTLFRRLAWFRGHFTLDAAERICPCDDPEVLQHAAVLDLLTGLVDKSLVAVDEIDDGSTRYRLLETVREYAALHLEQRGESELIGERHAEYYCALGNQLSEGMSGPSQPLWFGRVAEHLPNLRAAFDWKLKHEPRGALLLAVALDRWWQANAPSEGAQWLSRALANAGEEDVLRARALYAASKLSAIFLGAFDDADRCARECLRLAERLDSELLIGLGLHALSLVRAIEEKDGWQAESRRLSEQAEPYVRAAGSPQELAFLLNDYGFTLFSAGDPRGGLPAVVEAVKLLRAAGDDFLLIPALDSLAAIELAIGDRVSAGEHARNVLRLTRDLRSLALGAAALRRLADVAAAEGDHVRCVRLLAAETVMEHRCGATLAEPELRNRLLAGARVHLGAAADIAWREGEQMSMADAFAYGLDEGVEPPPVRPAPTGGAGEAGPSSNSFTSEGEYWTISFAGKVVRLRDSKGLRDVARLLHAPRREIAAVDLAYAGASPERSSHRDFRQQLDAGIETDAGAALDAQARRQYRERLAELEEEVVDAETANDPERASRACQEREFIVDALKAAVGLGGRDRRMLDPAERARKAVTGRIREAIARIEAVHPELGLHLRRSVRTGAFCVYEPVAPTTWSV